MGLADVEVDGDVSATGPELVTEEGALDQRPTDVDDEHERGDERGVLLARLREAMLASEPALDRSMVTGDSLDELEASFAAAKATLAQLRETVRREQAAAVPSGSTARAAGEPKSAFAKIREGLR